MPDFHEQNMIIFEEFEEFAIKKEELINDTYNI